MVKRGPTRDHSPISNYNKSLHRFITYNVADRIDTTTNHRDGPRWSWRKYDTTKLQNYLAGTDLPLTDVDATEGAVRLDKFLKEACDSCMPKGIYKGDKRPAYWWTQNIADLKKEYLSHQRKCKRNRQRNDIALQTENLERYKEARKRLKWEIQRSKRECWGGLCKQVEKDPWGLLFKLVTKKLVGRKDIPGITLPGTLENIVEHETLNFPPITIAEIKNWVNKIPAGRAPGPDGVPDLLIKYIALNKPEKFHEVFNLCLNHGIEKIHYEKKRS